MNEFDDVNETLIDRTFTIEKEQCIRCASCSSIAPSVFYVDAAGADILRQPINQAELKQCEAALINCPTGAIVSLPLSKA